jgi:hypothetical protein
MITKNQHNPAHLFVDDSPYFITGSIYQKRALLYSNVIKDHLLATIQQCFNEKDYFIRQNYLFNNPVKHSYVSNLNDYPYSSFHDMLKNQGYEFLVQQFRKNKPKHEDCKP